VPLRFDVCGLLQALLLTISVPVLVPTAFGANVTLMVHLLLAARLVVQVVADTAKSPVVEIAMLVNSTLWLLVRVILFGKLVVPAADMPRLAPVGISVAGSTPLPVSADVCGLLLALSLTLSVPVLWPNAVGVKVTLIGQCALAARLVVQLVADGAKSRVTVIVMLVSGTFWLLVSVNVFAVLVEPRACHP